MPNWTYINIYKDDCCALLTEEKIQYFKENYCKKVYNILLNKEVYEIDFNKFIPMPEKIIKRNINDEIIKSINYYYANHNLSEEDLEQLLTEKENDTINPLMNKVIEEYRNAGSPEVEVVIPNWYDWSIFNWGTKWNACDTQISNNRIAFNTAWNKPTDELMNKILKVIRDLMIQSFPEIPIEEQELSIEVEYEGDSDVYCYFTFNENEEITFIDKVIEKQEDEEA